MGGQREKEPDLVKIPKCTLSERMWGLKTTRMLAQKQPFIQKCVIAHWSAPAPKMSEAETYHHEAKGSQGSVVEGHCMREEAVPEGLDCMEENAGMVAEIKVGIL